MSHSVFCIEGRSDVTQYGTDSTLTLTHTLSLSLSLSRVSSFSLLRDFRLPSPRRWELRSSGLRRPRNDPEECSSFSLVFAVVFCTNYGYCFNTCTVHLSLLCAMTNKCTIISQIITLLHVPTLSCHPQTACNQYLTKLHQYYKSSCQQYNLQLSCSTQVLWKFLCYDCLNVNIIKSLKH
jgi:hypothetical protein